MSYNFVKNFKTLKKNVCSGSAEEIENRIDETKNPEVYEVITGACIPYYDFDANYNTEELQKYNYKKDLAIATESIKYQYDNGVIYIFDASGYDPTKKNFKNSFHFIVRNAGYYEKASQIPKIGGFDPAVYNQKWQLFRLPRCSKKGQNRPLLRIGKFYKDEKFADYIIQNIAGETKIHIEEAESIEEHQEVATQIVNSYIKTVKQATNIFNHMTYKSDRITDNRININFRRNKTTFCNICDRTHDGDGVPYLIVYPESNKIFYNCHQAKNKKSIFVCNINENEPVKNKQQIIRKTLTVDDKTIICNVRYCSDIPQFMDSISNLDSKLTICLKANMGTGKTYGAAKAINSYKPDARNGVISFRVTLATKYEADFDNFVGYKSKTERNITESQWICQLDSLHRIDKTHPMDRLILDEVSQARKHLTATTFMKNKNYADNRATLKYLIRTAKQVIIMDANLTDDDVNFIQGIRGGQKIVIVNTHTPTVRIINMTTDESIIREIIENLRKNEKCIIAHNGSVKKQEILARTIQKARPNKKILLINRNSTNKKDVADALNDPNSEWHKHDLIIYSPTVQSGISYDKTDSFDNVYGIFGNCSNSSEDASQMLHRVRHPINNKINVSITMSNFNSAKPTTAKGVKFNLTAPRKHILTNGNAEDIQHLAFEYNDLGEKVFCNSEIINEYCQNRAEANLDSINFKANFMHHQKNYGATITESKTDKKKDGIVKIEVKKSAKEHKIEKIQQLTDAENITVDKANAIKSKMEKNIIITDEDLLGLKKYNIHKSYNLEAPEVESITEMPAEAAFDWYDKYSINDARNHYFQQSKYFKKADSTFGETLKTIKLTEIEIASKKRVKHNEEGIFAVSTEQQIVDALLTNPVYQKHNIIINWLDKLGFESLKCDKELTQDNLKILAGSIVASFDNNTCSVLGKGKRKIENMRKLKPTDKTFIKKTLEFFNGSLNSEFGISIKKKSKNSKVFILDNPYIKDGSFTVKDNNNLDSPISNIPVLGKLNEWDKKEQANNRYLKSDGNVDPYDSEDE